MDEVLLSKATTIERCLRRIMQEYKSCPELDDHTHVDALILNLERAAQSVIDMAMRVISKRGLGLPRNSRAAFDLLFEAGIIDSRLRDNLKGMVGFRNIVVHDYQSIDSAIVRTVIEKGPSDLVSFCKTLGLTISAP